MRKINDSEGNLLCIVYKDEDWVEGLNFITDNSLFIQVGSWWYQNGKNLAKHKGENPCVLRLIAKVK